jgi:hypothetical protein
MVRMMRQPPSQVPVAMARAQATLTHSGMAWVSTQCRTR